jgi:hypothetical protein
MTKPKDDWGNYEIVFNKNYKRGKFNLATQPALLTHRGGWKNVLAAMKPLHNENGVRCETFIECPFDWFRNINIKNKSIPITEPWVGFIHNPHNMPCWYDNPNSVRVEDDEHFKFSLNYCKGIFAMSEYHTQGLKSFFPKYSHLFESILHPYSDEDFTEWQGGNIVLSVGWWLRKQTSIYKVALPKGYRRMKLYPYKKDSEPYKLVRSKLEVEAEKFNVRLEGVEERHQLDNLQYDKLLNQSIVLMDVFDTSANNTVLECIQRAVPILVPRHPSIVEYLGADYPLYFDKLDDVQYLIPYANLAVSHMKKIIKSEKLSLKSFISNIRKSKIYKQL